MTASAVKRYAEAWQAGDLAALVDCYSDNFTLHYFGRSPLAGDHVGKAAVLGTLQKVTQLTNRKLLEVHDILASDQHGAILARERFERDGKTLEVNRVLIYHFEGDKLSECWVYDEPAGRR